MVNLAVALGEICLKFVKTLIQSAASYIEAAVDAIVDAFLAFVRWAITFITDVVNAAFGPVIQPIKEACVSYSQRVNTALMIGVTECSVTGGVSSSTLSALSSAFFGDLYWVVLGVSVIVSLVIAALASLFAVFGMLISIAMASIVVVLAVNAIGLNQEQMNELSDERGESEGRIADDASSSSASLVWQLVLDATNYEETAQEPDMSSLYDAISIVFGVFAIAAGLVAIVGYADAGAFGYASLTLGILACILSFGSLALLQSKGLALFSAAIGFGSFFWGFCGTCMSLGKANQGAAITNTLGAALGFGAASCSVGAFLSE